VNPFYCFLEGIVNQPEIGGGPGRGATDSGIFYPFLDKNCHWREFSRYLYFPPCREQDSRTSWNLIAHAYAWRPRVDKLLVAGIDTVVGANLAAWLANRYRVVGLSFSEPIQIAGCETAACPIDSAEAAHRWIASERPQWVVYCGPAARSTWSLP
jgi:hypothetical protein